MAKLRAKDIAQAHDDALIAKAQTFVVSWFIGRAPDSYGKPLVRGTLWESATFNAKDYGSREMALSAARFAWAERGRDRYGRDGVINAVCLRAEGEDHLTLFVRPKA